MMFGKKYPVEQAEAELEPVLHDFRDSVHAWSAAEYGRPRTLAHAAVHRTLWRATAWALGCVLVVAGVSAGLYGHLHQQELALTQHRQQPPVTTAVSALATPAPETSAAEAPAERGAQGQSQKDENADLLAAVDSAVSRQVPSAMEPLAQLMDSSSIQ